MILLLTLASSSKVNGMEMAFCFVYRCVVQNRNTDLPHGSTRMAGYMIHFPKKNSRLCDVSVCIAMHNAIFKA